VIRESARNLYGTTSQGGAGNYGGVVLFTVDTAGHETVLHRFEHDSFPHSGVIGDPAGNVYGTTLSGGVCCGVVFKTDRTGKELLCTASRGVRTEVDPSRV